LLIEERIFLISKPGDLFTGVINLETAKNI
jgi:hypothetical protein